MAFHERTADAARGRWRGILMELGIAEKFLPRNPRIHGPCPVCGGRDRFRFDDREGRGTWICSPEGNGCGAGDGMKLAMLYTGKSFQEVASRIDQVVGNLRPETPRQEMKPEDHRAALRSVWKASTPCKPGDLVHRYLAGRKIDVDVPESLRFAAALRDGSGGIRPAMVAMVSGPDGKPATLHRTFLKSDGSGKAEMASPRKLMPGPVPEGSAIRLGPPAHAMGIAEGIETALAASMLFDLPVWAAVSSAFMAKWTPPEIAKEVCVFGDNDPGFAGQAAAYDLARRLRSKGADVVVRVPPETGRDWCDALARGFRT